MTIPVATQCIGDLRDVPRAALGIFASRQQVKEIADGFQQKKDSTDMEIENIDSKSNFPKDSQSSLIEEDNDSETQTNISDLSTQNESTDSKNSNSNMFLRLYSRLFRTPILFDNENSEGKTSLEHMFSFLPSEQVKMDEARQKASASSETITDETEDNDNSRCLDNGYTDSTGEMKSADSSVSDAANSEESCSNWSWLRVYLTFFGFAHSDYYQCPVEDFGKCYCGLEDGGECE